MLDRLPVSGDWMMGLAALSLAMLVVSPLVLAVVVTWLPADYFVTGEPPLGSLANRHPAVRVAFHLGKNVAGVLLVLAGLVMLVTPGQGVLTLLAGVMLLDVPGKRAIELKIVRNPRVFRAINKLRARAHHPPLELPPG